MNLITRVNKTIFNWCSKKKKETRKFLPFDPIDRQIILNKLSGKKTKTISENASSFVTRSLKCDVSSRERNCRQPSISLSPGQMSSIEVRCRARIGAIQGSQFSPPLAHRRKKRITIEEGGCHCSTHSRSGGQQMSNRESSAAVSPNGTVKQIRGIKGRERERGEGRFKRVPP